MFLVKLHLIAIQLLFHEDVLDMKWWIAYEARSTELAIIKSHIQQTWVK